MATLDQVLLHVVHPKTFPEKRGHQMPSVGTLLDFLEIVFWNETFCFSR